MKWSYIDLWLPLLKNKVFAWNYLIWRCSGFQKTIIAILETKQISQNNKNEWNVLATSNVLQHSTHDEKVSAHICSDDMHFAASWLGSKPGWHRVWSVQLDSIEFLWYNLLITTCKWEFFINDILWIEECLWWFPVIIVQNFTTLH